MSSHSPWVCVCVCAEKLRVRKISIVCLLMFETSGQKCWVKHLHCHRRRCSRNARKLWISIWTPCTALSTSLFLICLLCAFRVSFQFSTLLFRLIQCSLAALLFYLSSPFFLLSFHLWNLISRVCPLSIRFSLLRFFFAFSFRWHCFWELDGRCGLRWFRIIFVVVGYFIFFCALLNQKFSLSCYTHWLCATWLQSSEQRKAKQTKNKISIMKVERWSLQKRRQDTRTE